MPDWSAVCVERPIVDFIDSIGVSPYAGTPTASSLEAAKRYFDGRPADPNRNSYVLLATDGLPSCGEDGTRTVAAVRSLASARVRTFVLGLSNQHLVRLHLVRDVGGCAQQASRLACFVANDARVALHVSDDAIGTRDPETM